MPELPTCKCGSNSWAKFHEDEHPISERRVRKFECETCEAEGRIFDRGGDDTVYSGAMRQ